MKRNESIEHRLFGVPRRWLVLREVLYQWKALQTIDPLPGTVEATLGPLEVRFCLKVDGNHWFSPLLQMMYECHLFVPKHA